MNLLICFLLEGPINSPAYFRALGMSKALKLKGVNVSIVCDDRPQNKLRVAELLSLGIKVYTYPYRPKILSIIECRRLLNYISPNWVVQLNPTLKSFFTLACTRHEVIGEWDEPSILVPQNLLKIALAYFLHFWLRCRSTIHVSCTKEFLRYLPEAEYIPHGQYVSKINYEKCSYERGEYFLYLGNFYPLFDHELLISGLLAASKRGFRPEVLMVGGGPDLERWKEYCLKHDLWNIKFKGYCEIEDCMPMLIGARALLFPMKDTPLNRCRCSSKIFAYLASGTPVIAHRVGEIIELLGPVSFLANPGEDLIRLLEKKVYETINMRESIINISYDHLAERFLKLINRVR
jgi:glycosyltransferase involved in cell wall biosynthesis